MMRDTIVAVAGDPGGANAVAPVIARLHEAGRLTRLFGYRNAKPLWENHGWTVLPISDDATPDALASVLADERIAAVLTATSVNGVDLEKRFIAAARTVGAPTLAVLDFWSAYRERFTDFAGELIYLPDRVAVMDELAWNEMIACGFPPDRLVVTGQPAFDELIKFRRDFTPQVRDACRRRWGCGDEDRVVVFFSQPLFSLVPPAHPRFPGYTEQEVIGLTAEACDRAAESCSRPVTLVLRPHPRENPADLTRHAVRSGRVMLDTDGDYRDAAVSADLVAGMTTVVLVEATLLGCVVLSIQPNLRGPDMLPTTRCGAMRAVYAGNEVVPALRALLCDSAARAAARKSTDRLHIEPNATERVIQLLDSLQAKRPVLLGATT